MIERVYKKARESGAEKVVVATDDRKILEKVKGFGGDAVMTSKEHLSGTDRVFEAAEGLGLNEKDIIVNVQGDEPLIPPRLIKQVAAEIDAENEVKACVYCLAYKMGVDTFMGGEQHGT